MQRGFSPGYPSVRSGPNFQTATRSPPSDERAVDFSARCRNDPAANAGGIGCRRKSRVDDISRGRSARRLKGNFAMNNWVLAAVLAAAALAMYVGIFVKIGG